MKPLNDAADRWAPCPFAVPADEPAPARQPGSMPPTAIRNAPPHQRGVSLIGFIVMLAVVSFFAYTAMKIVPAYYDYANVSKALNTIASQEARSGNVDVDSIHRALETQELSQYFDDSDVDEQNISVAQADGGGSTVTLSYARTIPWMYNIDFLISFRKSVHISASAD